jgi:hypothetical protein
MIAARTLLLVSTLLLLTPAYSQKPRLPTADFCSLGRMGDD